MTITPTPNAWPFEDEMAAIDSEIATLQRAVDQAQASSAVAVSEVASARHAIRALISARAEILEKARLWDREAQLQRALAERQAAADRVRQALGAGGPLAAALKTALEDQLRPKLAIDPATGPALTDASDPDSLCRRVQTAEEDLGDAVVAAEYDGARAALQTAEEDYRSKADVAEAAWEAIHTGAQILQAKLQQLQGAYAEARRLVAAAADPTPGSGGDPDAVAVSAVEAGIAWKGFNDAYQEVLTATSPGTPAGAPDAGETALREAWITASTEAKDALAVLLSRHQRWAAARTAYEQRRALRPARKPEEQAAMVARVLAAYNPPPPAP
jgi:hypothetical protein